MYRRDGYRVVSNDPMYEIVPYIMDKRYDASNSITREIDMDYLQTYISKCRKRGIPMNHMSIIIAAYLRTIVREGDVVLTIGAGEAYKVGRMLVGRA